MTPQQMINVANVSTSDYIHCQLPVGGELTIEAMDEYSRLEIGRKTYRFAREVIRNPELRAKVKARAAEIRADILAGKGYCAPGRNY